MQIKLTTNTDTNVTLFIVADKQTLTSIKQKVLQKLGKSVKIPGFRPGKAPQDMVEKHLDQQILQSEFIDQTLNHYYVQAIIKENLRVVGQPEVNLKKFVPFDTFEFDVTIDVIGEVKLPNYKTIKVASKKIDIGEVEIKDVISSLQKRLAVKTPVERPAKKGDEAVIDFAGSDDKGKPVNGAEGKEYPLTLGSDTFIPGFESNVIGMKTGQEKSFTIPFPKDYGVKALQGKKVTFKVTLRSVNELVEPKLDDDFAQQAGPFKTLVELKEDIKKQLTIEKQNQQDRELENELLQKIANKTEVAIPDKVIDEQVAILEEDEKRNLAYKGQTWQEHLDIEGITEEEHRKQNRKDAAEQVKIGIMLGAIGDKENIQITPEEIEIRMQLLKGQYPDKAMQSELDKPEARQDIASRLRTEKIINFLMNSK